VTETTYSENRARIVLGLEFLFLGIIFGAGLGLREIGLRIGAGVLLVAMLILFWRAFQSATLVIQEDVIVARSLLRNIHLRLREITGVRIAKGMVGLYERSYLVFDLIDGRHIAFKSMNSSPKQEGSAVEQAARDIANLIAAKPS
jgi:hypothetical protein